MLQRYNRENDLFLRGCVENVSLTRVAMGIPFTAANGGKYLQKRYARMRGRSFFT